MPTGENERDRRRDIMFAMGEDADLDRLRRLVQSGVPADALAFYGRWFQFETWLRQMIYVELRAKYGSAWSSHLSGRAPARVSGDARNSYMASADAGDLLTYAGVSDLFSLIEDQWPLFARYLLPKARWMGRADELRELRNRNAHCRRPHEDDLARIEQTLRDLEQGAREFYASYTRTHVVPPSSRDPVAKAWAAGEHEVARRLLGHAHRQYDVKFRLDFTVRPWATMPTVDSITGTEGALWHAQWLLGPTEVGPTRLWRDLERQSSTTELLIHLLLEPALVIVTFAAMDPPERIADAIGQIFDSILVVGRPMRTDLDFDTVELELEARRAEVARLPARVETATALSLLDPYEPEAFSIFAASS